MDTATSKEQRARYEELLRWLCYTVHELPAGVLYGPNAATPRECAELMEDLNEFDKLCRDTGRSQQDFIEACRWHFDHYPHYRGRSRHFASYAQYVEERNGPMKVARPEK